MAPPPTNPLSCGVVVELGPPAGLVGPGGLGVRPLEVLHDALHVAGAALDGEVPGHRDPDRPVGIGRDERGVLEPDLGVSGDGVAASVVERGNRRAVLPVEDVEALVRRHDDVLVAATGEVRRRHRPVDGVSDVGVPDRRPRGRVERPDRPGAVRVDGALDHGELAVALDVGQRGAAAGAPVQRGAPDLVALGVVDLDRVLVAGAGKKLPVPVAIP